jgi:phosphoserine phosphatase RsbU/P
MKKALFLSLHIGLILTSVIVIYYLYPITHHFGGMYLPVSKSDIEQHAGQIIDSLFVDIEDRAISTSIRMNRTVYIHTIREYGLIKGNRLLKENIPAFYWDIRLRGSIFETMTTSDTDEAIVAIDSRRRGPVRMNYDGYGRLLQFRMDIADTIAIPGVDVESARLHAELFLRTFTNLEPDTLTFLAYREEVFDNRTDHNFRWEDSSGPIRFEVMVTVAGSLISRYAIDFDVPEVDWHATLDTMNILSSSAPYVIIGIMMFVIGIRRIRSQEIGIRNGLLLGVLSGIFVGITIFIQFLPGFQWEVLIALTIGPIFIGAFIICVVAVSEAVGRQTWKEKFIPFDLILNGHIFHSEAGKSSIRGITYGLVIFTVLLLATRIADSVYPVWYNWPGSDPLENYSPLFPAVTIMLNEIWRELIAFTVMVLFLLSYLRQRIKKTPALIFIAAVIYGIMDWSHTFPASAGIIIAIIYAAVIVWILYRFDVVTTYLAILTFSIAGLTTAFFFTGNSYLLSEGYIVLSVFGILFAAGVVAQFTGDRISDYEDIAPIYQKYISERERLQRELEIAHEVQMGFLPKENPKIPKLDIAARCIPAHEVGGDYYDFISINDHLFGVVIGDVSGKGTKASFYMTLTKGILRSTARNATNPAQVLTDVNRTFYEIAERGSFISMVYGIFNLKENNLTLARAGHNPVILRKSSSTNCDLLHPKGIALGLDPGNLFSNSIHEMKVQYEPGDVFIFYTDGFSEASNKKFEEFGDERLLQSLQKHKLLSAGELLENIIDETTAFTGRTPQRDDMTIIVVRITDE